MYIRELEEQQFTDFCRHLRQTAQIHPFEVYYTVSLYVNQREYTLQIVPHANNCIAVLQAWEIDRGDTYPHVVQEREQDRLSELLDRIL